MYTLHGHPLAYFYDDMQTVILWLILVFENQNLNLQNQNKPELGHFRSDLWLIFCGSWVSPDEPVTRCTCTRTITMHGVHSPGR